MEGQQHGDSLKRGLKNRHIQLIALGGAIGTGLFLGIADTIKMAGPSVILGYAIGGFIAFLIIFQNLFLMFIILLLFHVHFS